MTCAVTIKCPVPWVVEFAGHGLAYPRPDLGESIVVRIHSEENKIGTELICHSTPTKCTKLPFSRTLVMTLTIAGLSTFDHAQQAGLFAQLRQQTRTKMVWPLVARSSPMSTRGAALSACVPPVGGGCCTILKTPSYRFFRSSSDNLFSGLSAEAM